MLTIHYLRRLWLALLLSLSASYASANMIFTFPDCLPDCERDDMQRYLADSGTEALFIKAIDDASKDVTFAMYTFSRQPIFDALVRAAAERGVKVRGIIDAAQLANLKPYCNDGTCKFGAPFDDADYPTLSTADKLAKISSLPLYQKASLAGKLKLLFHNSTAPTGANASSPAPEELVRVQTAPGNGRLMHHKYLLVDRRHLLTGSGNWSYTAFGINYENIAVLDGKKESDQALVEAFNCVSDLLADKAPSNVVSKLIECQTSDQVYFTPTRSGDEGIAARILLAINQSQKAIAISMHHLVYEPIYAALLKAVERGVEIRLLFDDDDCFRKTPPAIRSLLEKGGALVQVRYLPTNCELFQLSHSKYGVFDSSLVINGSANWSKAGLIRNYENFIVYKQPEHTAQFLSNFDRLWAYAKPKPACGCELREESCRSRFCIGRGRP